MAILGIDEVGRGPLAGPLVVGAVILPENYSEVEGLEWIFELKDSKKLSKGRREELNEKILREASATGLGWVFPEELDRIGISKALELATKKAVKSVRSLHVPFSQIIIDGKVNFLKGTSLERFVSTMPKADNLVREVSAASIIAKVARDQYMVRLAKEFPEYGFESHVGYGTKKHLEAIFKYGICREHRKSFEPIRSMVGFSQEKNVVKNTTVIGNRAEEVVAEYLVHEGHKIIARNFKMKFFEIDIVSIFQDKIYFTEVKYRKTKMRGGGLAAITREKKRKMEFAAESFLKLKPKFKQFSPQLSVAEVSGEDFLLDTWFSLEF